MPILSFDDNNPLQDGRQSSRALEVKRGVVRQFSRMGVVLMPELTLANGRRADLIGLDRKGNVIIIEIKSSVEDFRVDQKWPEYRQYCDQFYFATLADVPAEIFPQSEGFIIADNYGCEVIRDADVDKISGGTRKALTIRFARAAAQRLDRVIEYSETEGFDVTQKIDDLSGE